MLDSPPLLTTSVGAIASTLVGALTVWLAVRKRFEEESLGRAARRTAALQLLSDEEFTLEQVRDECAAIETLVGLRDFGVYQGHLRTEADRIKAEALHLLNEVRARRTAVQAGLARLGAAELEAVIAQAYHGKRRAEAQLKRTQLSRTELLGAFGEAPRCP